MVPHNQFGGGNRPQGGLATRPVGNNLSGQGFQPGGRTPSGTGGSGQRLPNAGNNFTTRPATGGSGQGWANAGTRPNWSTRPATGGSGLSLPNAGTGSNWANRPGAGGSGERWPNAGNQPNWANRPGAGGRWPNTGDRPNWSNYTSNYRPNQNNLIQNNLTQNNFNQTNFNQNNFTSNRFNNFNSQPWGYNYYHSNWAGWHSGSWNNWNSCPAAWYTAGAAASVGTSLLWGAGANYSYSNPFYVESPSVATDPALDYSQPVQVPTPVVNVVSTSYASPVTDVITEPDSEPAESDQQPLPQKAADQVPPEASRRFDAAREAFKSKEYDRALKEIEEAIKVLPKDATLHEFRALVLFAQKNYKDAAAGIYAVLAVGPGWNWDTLSGLYTKPATYTKQLRTLEAYVRDNPTAIDGRFLLAYHYLVLGSVPDAVKQLKEFEKLVPKDQLAPQLVKAFTESPDSDKPKAVEG
jgi:tetratricopeptide (TPR) repeat protein